MDLIFIEPASPRRLTTATIAVQPFFNLNSSVFPRVFKRYYAVNMIKSIKSWNNLIQIIRHKMLSDGVECNSCFFSNLKAA